MFSYSVKKFMPLISKVVYFSTKPSVVINIIYNIGDTMQTTQFEITGQDPKGADIANLPFWLAAGMTKLVGECIPDGAVVKTNIISNDFE